jgi:thiol-disulfide isomerase/thioredoxin
MKKLFFITCISYLLSCNSGKDRSLSNISTLPSFDMLLIDSVTRVNARQIPAGKPIVLLFFRPDCPHCKEETKTFIQNIDALKNVQIYLVTGSPFEKVKGFYTNYHLDQYPTITVANDYEHSFAKVFNPRVVPYIVVYDKNKNLVKIFHGEVEISTLLNTLHI